MHQGKLLGAVDSLSNNPGTLFVALRWETASRKHNHGDFFYLHTNTPVLMGTPTH